MVVRNRTSTTSQTSQANKTNKYNKTKEETLINSSLVVASESSLSEQVARELEIADPESTLEDEDGVAKENNTCLIDNLLLKAKTKK